LTGEVTTFLLSYLWMTSITTTDNIQSWKEVELVDRNKHIPLPRHPASAMNKPPQIGLSPPGFNDSVI